MIIHKAIFGNRNDIPVYVFIIELLIIEFSKKVEIFTMKNIFDYLENSNCEYIQDFYNNKFYFEINYLKEIKNKKNYWTEICDRICVTKDDKRVVLFFKFVEDIKSLNYNIFKIKDPYNIMPAEHIGHEITVNDKFVIYRFLNENTNYQEIDKYIFDLIAFFRMYSFIDQL